MEDYRFEASIRNRLDDIKKNISYLTSCHRLNDKEVAIIIKTIKDDSSKRRIKLLLTKIYKTLIDDGRIEPFIETDYERQLYNLYYHDIGPQGWWADRYVDQFEEMKAAECEKTLLAKVLIEIIEDVMERWKE